MSSIGRSFHATIFVSGIVGAFSSTTAPRLNMGGLAGDSAKFYSHYLFPTENSQIKLKSDTFGYSFTKQKKLVLTANRP